MINVIKGSTMERNAAAAMGLGGFEKVGGEFVDQAFGMVPWLRDLSGTSRAWLGQHARLRRLKRGQLLLDHGEVAPALVLLEGLLLAERAAAGKRPVVFRRAQPMDCVAVEALLEDQPTAVKWRASGPALVLQVGRVAFLTLLRTDPRLATLLAAQVASQVRRANQRVLMLSCSKVEERVLQLLRELAQQDLHGRWLVQAPMSQKELAACVAASREMASRSLAGLKRRGLLRYDQWSCVEVAMTDDPLPQLN